MELGTYKAVKDVSMDLSKTAWLLIDGGKIEVEQLDNERSKALVRCGDCIDWMHYSRINKCFVKEAV